MKKSAGIAAALLALLLMSALPVFASAGATTTTAAYIFQHTYTGTLKPDGYSIILRGVHLVAGDNITGSLESTNGSAVGVVRGQSVSALGITVSFGNVGVVWNRGPGSFSFQAQQTGAYDLYLTYCPACANLPNASLSYRLALTIQSSQPISIPVYFQVVITDQATGTTEAHAVLNGSSFTLNAPNKPYFTFIGWKGTGPGSYTGPLQEATITPLGNITETATYSYNPYAAFYGTYIAPFFDQPLSLFVLTVSLLSALFLTRVLSLDPNQARHMGMVIAAVALLDAVGFPFVYYDASCFQSPPGCIGANVPLRLTGSWVIGSYPIYPSFLITSVIAPAIVAAALLISSEKKGVTTPMPAGEGGEHRFIAAIYIVFAFLMRDYYLQLLFLSLYQPGQPYYDLLWFRGLTTVLVALPLWALTMPKAPIGSWQTPSRRVVGLLGVLSIAAFITASRTFLFQPISTLSFLTSHSQNLTYTQISPPLFVALSVAGLLAWRRPWRVNGLFTAAFFFSGVSTFLLLLLASLNVSFSISYAPVFVLLSFPAMALVYRHYKSKLWVLLALTTSLFGLPSLIVYAFGVYELIFNVRALPSLKAPAFSKSRTQLKDEELKEEEKKEE